MSFPSQITQLPPFDGPFDAHRLAAEGCEVLFASYPPGTVIEPHAHETHNVGVITKGELLLTIDGTERRYGPGDWYEVGPDVVHAARFETETNEIELWFGGS
jgi:quercetin dioxygenase-like cupin family protein